jgi:hypothetical protein
MSSAYRTIEHEDVRRAGEQFGEHQSVAFAAGQRTGRLADGIGRKEKVAQVPDRVPAAGGRDDEILVAAQIGLNGPFRIDVQAVLVKIRDFQSRAVFHLALLRRKEPEQDLEQGGLAAAVGTDDADMPAAMNRDRHIRQDARAAVGVRYFFGHHHVLARALGEVLLQGHRAGAFPPQGFQFTDATLVPRAARLDALPDP